MKQALCKGILSAAVVASCAGLQAQSNVYSLSIYAGGTSYHELCAFNFPFPPYHFKITQRSRYENADGLVIIDFGHEKERGGVLCRYLDVECGTESFTVPLDRPPPLRARLLAAESDQQERREKAWLASGYFQIKAFTLSNRTDSLADQEDLFQLEKREKFHDGYWTRGMGPESNVIRITASTNDMVIWDRIVREFDKPSTQTDTPGKPPGRFPITGISSADLQPAFRDFKQLLPTNGVSILSMDFDDSDNALITARITDKAVGAVRDFRFQKAGGKWRATGEMGARPANYPKQGVTPAELQTAISQIKESLPNSGILWLMFTAPTRIEVTTGRQNGPRSGRGVMMYFQKNDKKWEKTGEGEWLS